MKTFSRLLATPTAAGSTRGLKPAPLALLPPIPLYRRILRTHRRHLDPEMRLLGDQYVRAEFRAHREVENPVHIVGVFLIWFGLVRVPLWVFRCGLGWMEGLGCG